MIRVIGFMLLYSTLSIAFPFPFPAEPAPAPPTPVVPTSFPFAPGPRPGAPGYNNPYYNYAGGAAIPIVSYSSEHGLDGTYAFSFATADGKQAQENGFLKDAYIDNAGEPQGTQVVQGSYSYISPEGTPIQVNYVADENGFRPSGVHIPADGKSVLPVVDKDKQPFDPVYNRYNPYYNRNRYNPFGQYNNLRQYDPRYPYDPANFSPYFNNRYPVPVAKNTKEEAKKETA